MNKDVQIGKFTMQDAIELVVIQKRREEPSDLHSPLAASAL